MLVFPVWHYDKSTYGILNIVNILFPLIFFRFLFYEYMVVFLFNIVIYVFLLKESMYS